MRKRLKVIFIFFSLAVVVSILNLLGVCWHKFTIPSDDFYIRTVVQARLEHPTFNSPPDDDSSVEAFLASRPDCCNVERLSWPMEMPVLNALLFNYRASVWITFSRRDGDDSYDYTQSYLVSPCGNVRANIGSKTDLESRN